jgi:multidrug efflux system outer membrane protein
VADALSAQARSREVFEAESTRVQMLTDALRLARIRFDNGLISQLEIIDAERNLLAAQLNRIDALRAQRVALADLSRALGGGWTAPAGAATVPPAAKTAATGAAAPRAAPQAVRAVPASSPATPAARP